MGKLIFKFAINAFRRIFGFVVFLLWTLILRLIKLHLMYYIFMFILISKMIIPTILSQSQLDCSIFSFLFLFEQTLSYLMIKTNWFFIALRDTNVSNNNKIYLIKSCKIFLIDLCEPLFHFKKEWSTRISMYISTIYQ